jgi:hypothetical protein
MRSRQARVYKIAAPNKGNFAGQSREQNSILVLEVVLNLPPFSTLILFLIYVTHIVLPATDGARKDV